MLWNFCSSVSFCDQQSKLILLHLSFCHMMIKALLWWPECYKILAFSIIIHVSCLLSKTSCISFLRACIFIVTQNETLEQKFHDMHVRYASQISVTWWHDVDLQTYAAVFEKIVWVLTYDYFHFHNKDRCINKLHKNTTYNYCLTTVFSNAAGCSLVTIVCAVKFLFKNGSITTWNA